MARLHPTKPGLRQRDSLSAARLDLLRAQLLARQLENARLAGELVAFAEYERRAGELGRFAREGMSQVARRLAEPLAAEGDPKVVARMLQAEIDQALAVLADRLELRGGAAAAAADESWRCEIR